MSGVSQQAAGCERSQVIAFKVSVNGKHVCTAGVRDFGTLSTIVTWVRRRPEYSKDGKSIEEELHASVGAFESKSNAHKRWLAQSLRVGDRITVEVTDSKVVDRPKRRYREDPKQFERAKRKYFERLKKEFASDSTRAVKSSPKPTPRADPSRRKARPRRRGSDDRG